MNGSRLLVICAAAVALPLAWLPAVAAAPDTSATTVELSLGAGSRLWIEGTSTIHEWESGSGQVTVRMTHGPGVARPADAGGLESLIRASAVSRVEVLVPVATLHSKKSGLDKNLWKAMKSEAYPAVRCQLTRYTVTPGAAAGDTLGIRAEGTLEIAGQSRPVTLEARAWRAPDGIWITGSEPLLMSEYGIKPPTMMMGTLRVADRVVVHYRLLLTPKDDGAGSPPAGAHEKGEGK